MRILNLVRMEFAFEVSFLVSYEKEEARAFLVSQWLWLPPPENGRVLRTGVCVPSGRVYFIVHPQAFLNI